MTSSSGRAHDRELQDPSGSYPEGALCRSALSSLWHALSNCWQLRPACLAATRRRGLNVRLQVLNARRGRATNDGTRREPWVGPICRRTETGDRSDARRPGGFRKRSYRSFWRGWITRQRGTPYPRRPSFEAGFAAGCEPGLRARRRWPVRRTQAGQVWERASGAFFRLILEKGPRYLYAGAACVGDATAEAPRTGWRQRRRAWRCFPPARYLP